MKELWKAMKGFMRDEEGATAVEYGVMVALIIAICVVIITVLGQQIRNAFSAVNNAVSAGVASSAS
jgi:pilus assembly protein Flp/PilA